MAELFLENNLAVLMHRKFLSKKEIEKKGIVLPYGPDQFSFLSCVHRHKEFRSISPLRYLSIINLYLTLLSNMSNPTRKPFISLP